MKRLRSEANNSDLEMAYRFLIANPLARHVPLAPLFPVAVEDSTSAPYFNDGRFEAELAAQKARFAASEKEILRAILSIKAINENIFERDPHQLSDLIATHVEDFGISLFLLRKVLSVRHTEFGRNAQLNFGPALDPFLSHRRHILAVAFEDSVDEERSYIRVRRNFLFYAKNKGVSRGTQQLLLDLFSPETDISDVIAFPLEAYSRWGVLDSLAFLERILVEQDVCTSDILTKKIQEIIPVGVHAAWQDTCNVFRIEHVIELLEGERTYTEYRLFRHSSAWAEIPAVALYRNQIEAAAGQRLDGKFPVTGTNYSIVARSITDASDLLPENSTNDPTLPIDPKICGVFHRSIALANIYHPSFVLSISDGIELLNLLDATMDVSMLLSIEELATLLPARSKDFLYEYLRTALYYDAEEGRVNNHAHRRATQNIVVNDFRSNIVDFAVYLDSRTPHVAEYLFATCNEYFLTELYLLFSNSDAIIDAQAHLLEWYGQTREDENAVTRAKSHRLNLRLRRVRGTIDDTRIYVDPLKFQYWAIDKIAAQLRSLTIYQNVIQEGENIYIDLNDPIAAVENPRTKLIHILNQSYKEFCENKYYGADSYIGRRIRHGTLHGVLVAELRMSVESICEEFRFCAPAFSNFVSKWYCQLEAFERKFGSELLQVRSIERKNGLIIPSLGDSDKRSIVLNMLSAVAKTLANDRSIASAISYIYDYCWLLLEVDLKRLRAAAASAQQELVIRSNQHVSGLASDVDARVLDATRRLNTELQQKFESLASWLTRPANVSPSATLSLLFHAVIHEVGGRYPEFCPKITEVGETAIDMFGHRFHTFYDVLFVLVDNAARHGKRGGELWFEVRSSKHTDTDFEIRMTVTSELELGAEQLCNEAIATAMLSNLGLAMVEDNNSGIRKIRTLVEEVDELTNFSVDVNHEKASFVLTMKLALAGTESKQGIDK